MVQWLRWYNALGALVAMVQSPTLVAMVQCPSSGKTLGRKNKVHPHRQLAIDAQLALALSAHCNSNVGYIAMWLSTAITRAWPQTRQGAPPIPTLGQPCTPPVSPPGWSAHAGPSLPHQVAVAPCAERAASSSCRAADHCLLALQLALHSVQVLLEGSERHLTTSQAVLGHQQLLSALL